jgi:hypothetical protein
VKRVKDAHLIREVFFDSRRHVKRLHDPLVRGFRGIIAFNGFGCNALFGDQFNGRAEEIVKAPPFVGIEVV